MNLALIDGDIIAYRCAVKNQQSYDWGDTGGKVIQADPVAAGEAALRMVEEWRVAASCRDVIVAFTGTENFRKRILPTYKAGRKEKPPAHAATVERMQQEFPYHLIQGLEADDVMGILATTATYRDRAIVVTIDKDLKTIPGTHLNPTIENARPVTIDERQADYWWMVQTLIGDPTDGYTGLPGVGIKNAEKILGSGAQPAALGQLWARVKDAYGKRKLTEADALVQARVARILRREDYDKVTKEVLLWHPTKTCMVRVPVLAGPSDPET